MSPVTPAHSVEYFLVKALWAAASRIPPSGLLPAFETLATLLFRLGLRRTVVMANLRAALGDTLQEADLRRIAIGCYARLGRALGEIVHADRLMKTGKVAFDISGREHLDAAIGEGRGVVVLTAHLGNFLLGGYPLRNLGYRLVYVAKRMKNPRVDEEIQKIYAMQGNVVIPIRGFRNDPAGGLRIFRALKKGETVVMLNDQDAGSEGYVSRFFGLPASIPSGPAAFAHRAGATVLTGFATGNGGTIRVEFQPPIGYSSAGSGEEAVARILDEYSRRLEEKVRQSPEDYFWLHKKWKSAPGVGSMYKRGAP
jgi:Kdo2-lipid IVA lauroyltransferase/acyltransferase